jgi:hypothetical protein
MDQMYLQCIQRIKSSDHHLRPVHALELSAMKSEL